MKPELTPHQCTALNKLHAQDLANWNHIDSNGLLDWRVCGTAKELGVPWQTLRNLAKRKLVLGFRGRWQLSP